MTGRRFASKRDPWLLVAGWSAAVVCVVALTPILMINLNGLVKIVIGSLLILTVALIAWITFATYYVVDAQELRIRSGPFRWVVPFKEIRAIHSTRAAWSSPALSLDRLRIEYGDGKWILVSPQRRDEFVHALGVPIASP